MQDLPWAHSYPAGVRWDAALPAHSAAALLDDAVRQWPDQPAIDFMDRKISYRELSELVDRAAAGFQKLGVKPGVHVGLYLPNTPQYVISFFGVLKAGGAVVNYSPLDAEQVLRHKVDDSETQVLVTLNLAGLYPKMRPLLGERRLKWLVVGAMGDFAAHGEQVDRALAQDGTALEPQPDARQIGFTALLDNDGQHRTWPVADPTVTLAVLQYTGGTTGLPKGAMLSHANLTVATAQATLVSSLGGQLLQGGCERMLVVLPLFHVYAMVVNMLLGVKIGAEMVLCTRFDPLAVLRDIATRGITVFPGVPTMFTALVNHPEVGQHDIGSLKACASAGAPLPVELMHRFEQLTGCHLTDGWGMSETTSMGTFTPAIGVSKPGSCGMPVPGVMLRFLDLEDPERDVPRGQPGEVAIRGPNVMMGYWKNDASTAEGLTSDGCFRTGDVAYMDEDGFVFIVDRTKDMLLCGGFNVYPRVIEEAIYAHPMVEEVMVIGIEDSYRGQAPKAFIKLRQGATGLTLEALQTFLRPRLGKHEMVHAMEVRSELPRTGVGKLSKKMLRDEIDKLQAA